MVYTLSNVPSDLHNKILDTYLESPSIDIKTFQKMSEINKNTRSYTSSKLRFFKNTITQKFCKLRQIENIFAVIKESAFDFDRLNSIVNFITETDFQHKKDFNELIRLCEISFSLSTSMKCINNTFIVFQFLKHRVIMCKKSENVYHLMDSILFKYFENLYRFKTNNDTSPTKIKEKLLFSVDNIDFSWHTIGLNLYYIYEVNRLYYEKKQITLNNFKTINKYIISGDHEISKNTVKFIVQQNNLKSNDIMLLIFNFILNTLIKQKLVKLDDRVKILFEEEHDSYKIHFLISKIKEDFSNSLSFVSKSLTSMIQS
jgi:hypothetical protein